MISAHELRLGNIIMLDGKHAAKVIAIKEHIVTTENPNNRYTDGTTGDDWDANSDFLSYLPLTPEILDKAGFGKKGYADFGGDYQIGRADINLIGFFFESYFVTLFNGARLVDLQYLHQLQNLHFALTGEEITIEL